jgi:3-methyladenine DNA glycosylase/8-oxoguanine DNA glycosylase
MYDLGRTAAVHAFGRGDPTTKVGPRELWRAARTPQGPGTLHVWLTAHGLRTEAWGPGAEWLVEGVPALLGLHREPPVVTPFHPVVERALARHPGVRIGANRSVFHTLLPAILGQRVTVVEAKRAWFGLCRVLRTPAPGPPGLLLPPAPEQLAERPYWWFHRFGVERERADTIIRSAKLADRLEATVDMAMPAARARLQVVPGIGPWTAAEVTGPALGDVDAVPVGDLHIPNMVSYALAGEPRGTDERMLELLAPYEGHRGLVLRLLGLHGPHAPAFGPRHRIMPIARW